MRRRLALPLAAIAAALALGATAALVLTACARTPQKPDAGAYAKEIEDWRAKRVADLKSESGWLTLIGLFWLKEGENQLGSDLTNDIILPPEKVTPRAGKFIVQNGSVKFEAGLCTPCSEEQVFTVDGKPISSIDLESDADLKPTILRRGSLSFQIIERDDKLGLRVKDSANPDRANFQGIQSYPTDLKWRIEGRFEPYNPPRPMPIMIQPPFPERSTRIM